MAVTILTSASGAPGVTTTAVGLAVHWPNSSLLVDADHQQAILVGYLQGRHPTGHGMVNVINAARISPEVQEAVWRQSIRLPDDDPQHHRRLFLPGLPSGQAAAALNQSWAPIARAFTSLDQAGVDIIVDVGRLPASGLHPALMAAATQVVLVTRPTLRAIGACHWAAQLLTAQAAQTGTGVGLAILRRPPWPTLRTHDESAGHGYSDGEIKDFLSAPIFGNIVHDPANARLLSDGGERDTKFVRSGYAASLRRLAETLTRTDLKPTSPASADLLTADLPSGNQPSVDPPSVDPPSTDPSSAGLPSAGLPSAGLPSAGLPSVDLVSAGRAPAALTRPGRIPSGQLPAAASDTPFAGSDPSRDRPVRAGMGASTAGRPDPYARGPYLPYPAAAASAAASSSSDPPTGSPSTGSPSTGSPSTGSPSTGAPSAGPYTPAAQQHSQSPRRS